MAEPGTARRGAMARRVGAALVRTPGAGVVLAPTRVASFAIAALVRGGIGPDAPDVPRGRISAALAAQVALDEVLLGFMRSPRRYPSERDWARIAADLAATVEFYDGRGWLADPASYHGVPPALEEPVIRRARAWDITYERLSWPSGFRPHDGEPRGAEWASYGCNDTAHAWVVRAGKDRPWLVCLHGFGVGVPAADFFAFRAARLSRELGLNLLFPIMPFHGPRRAGLFGGGELLSHELHRFVIGIAHAMWDIRRVIGWARSRSDGRIGAYGMSLGGYLAALLATFDPNLELVVAGAPVSDVPALLGLHVPARVFRRAEAAGVSLESMRRSFSVVSPLAMPALVPPEQLYLYAALGDRLATPEQARALRDHWGTRNVLWDSGAHLSFLWSKQVARFIDDALTERLG